MTLLGLGRGYAGVRITSCTWCELPGRGRRFFLQLFFHSFAIVGFISTQLFDEQDRLIDEKGRFCGDSRRLFGIDLPQSDGEEGAIGRSADGKIVSTREEEKEVNRRGVEGKAHPLRNPEVEEF